MAIPRRERKKLRAVQVGKGLPSLVALRFELQGYFDVLLGREDHPLPHTVEALSELANAYLARAREIEALIYQLENDKAIQRGHPLQKFRTGELRSWIEIFAKTYELGSRRITLAVARYREKDTI